MHGLQAFVASGWADQALLLGWTTIELYRVSFEWFRVDLTGAALLIAPILLHWDELSSIFQARPISKTASLINRYILSLIHSPKLFT